MGPCPDQHGDAFHARSLGRTDFVDDRASLITRMGHDVERCRGSDERRVHGRSGFERHDTAPWITVVAQYAGKDRIAPFDQRSLRPEIAPQYQGVHWNVTDAPLILSLDEQPHFGLPEFVN